LSVQLPPFFLLHFFDPNNSGVPLQGGKLFTYTAGTSTKQATWTDYTQTVQNTNPIILDSRGECSMWLDPTLIYKLVLSPANDTDPPTSPLNTVDNVNAPTFYPRTAAEISAGVTPVNYQYAPGVIDRYGVNTVPGTTDMTAAINAATAQAAQGGPPPTALSGIYFVASSLTMNQGYINLLGGKSYILPASGVVITVTGPIFAGVWKIFDVSNTSATGSLTAQTSLQTGFTPIAGPCPIEKCYAEWFGAIGNGTTDDFPATQAACNFSMSSYGIPVQFQAKKYFFSQTLYGGGNAYQLGTASGGLGTVACSIYGVASSLGTVRGTYFTDNGTMTLTGGQPILRFRNHPSYDQHNEVRDITFDSVATTSNAIGIEWAGICNTRAVNCVFAPTGLYEAVRWNNTLEVGSESAAIYTEYDILEKCEVWGNCVNAVGHFLTTVSNDPSFHGCGFESRCVLSAPLSSNPVVLVDAGSDWYNGILDAQIFGNIAGTAFVVVQNNSAFNTISVSGRTTLEIGAVSVSGAAGNVVFHTGDIRSNGPNFTAGTLVRCRALTNSTTGAPAALGAECNGNKTLSAGTTTLTSTIPAYTRDINLTVIGTNYTVAYRLFVSFLAPGGAVANLYNPSTAPAHLFGNGSNFSTWGDCTFAVSSTGQLEVTNANFTGTVTAYWSERQLYPGSFGGQGAYT
jgi:hypothetical protein